MKPASFQLLDILSSSHSVSALPRVRAEWNLNRYYNVFADNTPAETSDGFDVEIFPIESIYAPNRPTKGINKARVGESLLSGDYTNPPSPRFYLADYDDKYKYWTSPSPSDGSGVLTGCQPYVVYGTRDAAGVITYEPVSTNKIVIGFENSWATPENFTIELRIGGTWTSVFINSDVTDTTWEHKGRLTLRYNGTSWRQGHPFGGVSQAITGIRVTVTSLKGGVKEDGTITSYTTSSNPYTLVPTTGNDSHCSVIEISARLEADLTDDLITFSDNTELSEASNLYPIGTITSNDGSMTLWNGENTYNKDNQASPFANLLEPNVEITMHYIYDVNGSPEVVDQFVMYTGEWSGQRSDEANVSLTDYSKFFQETVPNPVMWENLTVSQIVFRLCDAIGFNNYVIESHASVTDFKVPVFWADGEKNLWEILDELAKASQTAIFFDSLGRLRVKTREAAMDDTAAPDYTLRGETSGAELANISTMDQTDSFEANSVKVSYSHSRWSDYNNGQPVLQSVWSPEDTVALRSTPLIRSMDADDLIMYIAPAEVKYWKHEGTVNIEGEIIKYSGLEFAYYTYVGSTGTRNVAFVKSAEEQAKFHEMTPLEYRFRNALTGGIQIVERAVGNTTARAHSVDASGYFTRSKIYQSGTWYAPSGGSAHLPMESKFQLQQTRKTSESDLLLATTGSPVDTPFWFYGTKLRIMNIAGQVHQRAGLMFNNDGTSQENGYYIELRPTSHMTPTRRKTHNELMFYARTNGKWNARGGYGNRGVVIPVAVGIDYTIDVSFYVSGGNHVIKIWVNGKLCMNVVLSGTDRVTPGGRFGMFVLGNTTAKFDYLYALTRQEQDPPDDFSWMDKKTGAYTGDLWQREWVYRLASGYRVLGKKTVKTLYKVNDKFFDEFGPQVHEIREFDVKFEPKPVLHSRPFMTNDWCAALLDYNSTPFGAKFTIANVARINAIINGEDSLTFAGSGESVNQVLAVYGRPLVIDEAKEVSVKSDLQIKRHGKIESELASTWIQNESMAKAVADWILKHMAMGNEEIRVQIFGNPLIEIGDVVEVFYQHRELNGDKYFVTGTSNEWNNGISTTLTLRRANVL